MKKNIQASVKYALNTYSDDENEDCFRSPFLASPAVPQIRREYYPTDYRDLKASLSSIYALPPKFELTGKTDPKPRMIPKDLLHIGKKRSASELRLIGLEDVRKVDLRNVRRASCCCTACGGYRLSQKFLISLLPRSEKKNMVKAKVNGLDGFMKNLKNLTEKVSFQKLPAILGRCKTQTSIRKHGLVTLPPPTPRLNQLLCSLNMQKVKKEVDRVNLQRTKSTIWNRIIPGSRTPEAVISTTPSEQRRRLKLKGTQSLKPISLGKYLRPVLPKTHSKIGSLQITPRETQTLRERGANSKREVLLDIYHFHSNRPKGKCSTQRIKSNARLANGFK